MTAVTLTAQSQSSPEIALTPSTVQTVTFNWDVVAVEVISDGAAKLRWTCDGSDPSNTHGYFMPALVMVDTRQPPTAGQTVVKLWSAGAPSVVVQVG